MTTPVVREDRVGGDLQALAELVDTDRPGWTRTALTDSDIAGRHWVLARMRDAGLDAGIDAAGNVVGRLPGSRGGCSIMLGSHTDTVDGGGRFDGMVGVIGALELVRCLHEADVRLAHDLVVMDFFSEEPNRFGLSCIGSRALTGGLTRRHLALRDGDGGTFAEALTAPGIDPHGLLGERDDLRDVSAFFELHIEQGPHLEAQGSQLGIVETITGIARFRALFTGRPDHAGTAPMTTRQDAGCAAAGTVLAVERIGSGRPDTRGTSGNLLLTPEAINVVTATAEMRGEFRGPDAEWLRHAQDALTSAASAQAATRGLGVELDWLPLQEPAAMSSDLLGHAVAAVDGLGLSRSTLFSGAEHDAAILSRHVPTAMLFVPSHDGRSHCPEEWTELADITAGITALTHTVLRLDAA